MLILFFSGEYGTKRDLINVSKAIADASIEVIRCAKALGKECTDKRMKAVSSHSFILNHNLYIVRLRHGSRCLQKRSWQGREKVLRRLFECIGSIEIGERESVFRTCCRNPSG